LSKHGARIVCHALAANTERNALTKNNSGLTTTAGEDVRDNGIAYYGSDCSNMCSNSCKDSLCNIDGHCLKCADPNLYGGSCDKCINGKYGNLCDNNCPKNCYSVRVYANYDHLCPKNRLLAEKCDACEEGTYGYLCHETCRQHCLNNRCNQEDGSCPCKKEYKIKGDKCVPSTCPANCSTCTSQNSCGMCVDKYYYGETCEHKCSNCKTGTHCSKTDGHCLHACADGLAGDFCDNFCYEGCETCQRFNASACVSCKSGRYGNNGKNYTCNRMCNDNCMHNSCDYWNGHCDRGCMNGYRGDYCNAACPIHCLNGTCDQNSGTCEYGCKNGYYGLECVNRCINVDSKCTVCTSSQNTFSSCTRCTKGSYPGSSGKCVPCEPNCSGGCNSSTGVCYACVDGYLGLFCNFPCASNCKSCLDDISECNECEEGFWDNLCLNNCSTNCKHGNDSMFRCNITYGKCKHGCVSGTFGSYCDRLCDKHCLASEGGALECIQKDGQCTLGCENGYIQTDAGCIDAALHITFSQASVTTPINKDDSTSVGTSWVVIGAACGVVAILALVLVIALFIRRRKDNYDRPNKDDYEAVRFIKAHQDNMVIPRTSTKRYKPQQLRDSAVKSEHVAMDVLIKTPANNAPKIVAQDKDTGDVYCSVNKVTVKELGALVASMDRGYYIDEFQKLPEGILKTYQDAMRPKNRFRNRYQDIYPYDDNRVKLMGGDTDFINASFVDGYKQENAYIASQGPTHKTMQDYSVFWRMVWQNKVGKIVMLTNLVEEMKPKCDQYWPGHELTNHYNEIDVTCLTEDIYADFVTRTFSVKMDKEERTVHHLHFTSWLDKGVPDDVTSLVDFRHRVLQTKSSLGGPTIVHCSSPVPMDGFAAYMSDSKNNRRLIKQFKQLEVISERSEQKRQTSERNVSLTNSNREGVDIPGELYRPRLYLGKEPGQDYINAMFVSSYKQRHNFVLAMTPLEETVADFLCLTMQETATCIVDMETDSSLYIPTLSTQAKFGSFTVDNLQQTSSMCSVNRVLRLSYNGRGGPKEHTVSHFRLIGWPDNADVPESTTHFLRFVKAVKTSAASGSVIAHCKTGGGRCGLFATVWTLLEKTAIEHEVSVFNTVRQLRARQPNAVRTREQYAFCHECVIEYLQSFDSHSNFS
ncbi:PTPRE-like protein, partial [Mya arenaria]